MGKKKSKQRSVNATNAASPDAPRGKVPGSAIIDAVKDGALGKLRQFVCRGARVLSAMPLCIAAEIRRIDMMRCLVKELHADVNQHVDTEISRDDYTALHVSAQYGDLNGVRCLVKELGADVNQVDKRVGRLYILQRLQITQT
jgi:ankyrin repeat protein